MSNLIPDRSANTITAKLTSLSRFRRISFRYAKKADCYFWPAQAIVEENSTLSIEDPKYNTNEEKIKALYEQAKPLYEKAKELEPDNKNIWGQFLLNIYWKLNKAEYEALEKEMGY